MVLKQPRSKRRTKLPDIMRAALELFGEKGIHATTTKEIARRAGVSEGALYRHYESKQALAEDLYITNLSHFTSLLERRVMVEKNLEQRLRAFVEGCFRFFDEDRTLFTYLILSEHNELGRTTRRIRHIRHLVRDILTEAREKGELREGDIELFGALVIGMILRVAVFRIYNLLSGDLLHYAPEVAGAAYRSVAR
ncbi:MAG: helix-turn-helix domain containing protein [Acidobacteriota bacterium]|jgi:TetR/AcrR family transcriptional regulator, repressor of fatR-cypB operon